MSSTTRAATSRGDKPLLVLTNPKWNFDRNTFDAEKFLEEANVSASGLETLRSRFDRFSSTSPDRKGEAFLSFDDFCRVVHSYILCRPDEQEHFFRAMDREGRGRLYFQDFVLGCAAASPSTPHILNSSTGLFRARYIFDFYNVSRSGTLDYEELARLLYDTRRHLDSALESHRAYQVECAQLLGEVSVATLRVDSISGPLCDIRVSTRWTGARVLQEIARQLEVPAEGQELLIGHRSLPDNEVVGALLPAGSTSARATLVRTNWERWPCAPGPSAADGLVGLERLVHVTFERFYAALIGERLRGTSRLFRFNRPIFNSKKSAMGGA